MAQAPVDTDDDGGSQLPLLRLPSVLVITRHAHFPRSPLSRLCTARRRRGTTETLPGTLAPKPHAHSAPAHAAANGLADVRRALAEKQRRPAMLPPWPTLPPQGTDTAPLEEVPGMRSCARLPRVGGPVRPPPRLLHLPRTPPLSSAPPLRACGSFAGSTANAPAYPVPPPLPTRPPTRQVTPRWSRKQHPDVHVLGLPSDNGTTTWFLSATGNLLLVSPDLCDWGGQRYSLFPDLPHVVDVWAPQARPPPPPLPLPCS